MLSRHWGKLHMSTFTRERERGGGKKTGGYFLFVPSTNPSDPNYRTQLIVLRDGRRTCGHRCDSLALVLTDWAKRRKVYGERARLRAWSTKEVRTRENGGRGEERRRMLFADAHSADIQECMHIIRLSLSLSLSDDCPRLPCGIPGMI